MKKNRKKFPLLISLKKIRKKILLLILLKNNFVTFYHIFQERKKKSVKKCVKIGLGHGRDGGIFFKFSAPEKYEKM
jgi:hypothetical protein